ncbi:hypothetical protein [Undibacterium sp. TS12]|uniref:tetratricopeptide repeat protein n=1 Tax=Undibacterium sp. TS12 TaxID=2908202 RepID=UPI001F4CE68D|nr:hypothetical protein [Undibacterium sp. TS12]MCH8620038.1 hypothetical protein [Undibacterium sp. TS12]
MPRILQFMLMMSVFSAAYAEDLNDAQRYYTNKDYARAAAIYTKMAQTGNPDAQEMLGEMYWFGDGVAVDVNVAAQWFKKAADGGQKKAQQFHAIIQERGIKAAEISYYTTGFDGRDVQLSKFNCVQPVIPAVSKTRQEISAVTASVNAWQACYNRFVAGYNAALPAGSAIPQNISALMNDAEMAQAVALMDKKYNAISDEANTIAININQKQRAWKAETEAFITADAESKKLEYDRMQNEMAANRVRDLERYTNGVEAIKASRSK